MRIAQLVTAIGLIGVSASVLAGTVHQKGTAITLSVTDKKNVANDQIIVDYSVSAEGKDTSELRHQVNKKTLAIKHRLSAVKGVTQTTLDRNLRRLQHYDAKKHRMILTGWRMTQTGEVRSNQIDTAPKWISEIENAGAHVKTLKMSLSKAAHSKAEASLETEAIKEFRTRASNAARALGATSYRIIKLNINTPSNRPEPLHGVAMAEVKSQGDKPALSAGKSQITTRVSGEIRIGLQTYNLNGK